jgi:ABC-type uncharacterized transport system permease subunit
VVCENLPPLVVIAFFSTFVFFISIPLFTMIFSAHSATSDVFDFYNQLFILAKNSQVASSDLLF